MFTTVGVYVDLLSCRLQALRAGGRRSRGASALEWAIIAAIAVVIATVIGTVIYNVVKDKGTQLQGCANQPVGSSCQH